MSHMISFTFMSWSGVYKKQIVLYFINRYIESLNLRSVCSKIKNENYRCVNMREKHNWTCHSWSLQRRYEYYAFFLQAVKSCLDGTIIYSLKWIRLWNNDMPKAIQWVSWLSTNLYPNLPHSNYFDKLHSARVCNSEIQLYEHHVFPIYQHSRIDLIAQKTQTYLILFNEPCS